MDARFHDALRTGLDAFGIALPEGAIPLLERYADRLLAWNQRVNLTAITAPAEVAEKHLVDSLLLLPFVAGARTLLDVGAGAGLPGVPLACARRDLGLEEAEVEAYLAAHRDEVERAIRRGGA